MGDYLLLIDGSSLLSTQYFGNLPREILYAKKQEEKERDRLLEQIEWGKKRQLSLSREFQFSRLKKEEYRSNAVSGCGMGFDKRYI